MTPRISPCLLVSLSLCLLVSPAPARADPVREYQNAVGNVDRAEYYTAILSLRRSIEENPNFVPAHLLMGDVLAKLGKFEDADSSYVYAEQKDPQNMEASTRRLKLFAVHLKDFDKAGKLIADVANRFGQSPEIHYYKALVLVGNHNYLNARAELKLAIALREKYFDARKLQLDIESIIGDPKRILEAAAVLLDDFPESYESYDGSIGHLLKAAISTEQILDLFSKAPPSLLLNPRFGRMMARLNLLAGESLHSRGDYDAATRRYEEAGEILKHLKAEGLSADEVEDLIYLKSLSAFAAGRQTEGIQILADFLQEVPDRPYLLMQLDLWLIRHTPASDPLRLQRAGERLKTGRQNFYDGFGEQAYIPLFLARKLNPRDKEIRRQLAEAAWRIGLAETARKEIEVAVDLDPYDDMISRRAKSFATDLPPLESSKRRIYNLFVFRLSDIAKSIRPSFGRMLTDAIALFAESLAPFHIQALEPAVPFEKAEEVAHQKGADFFLHGQIGIEPEGNFVAELGIFPIGGRGELHSLEFKEQHVSLTSRSDFTDEIILETVKALQNTASQYARVVKKEREGAMIVDIGRRHGLNTSGQFASTVLGRPLVSDVIQIYEWVTRVRVQEVERARYIGIGDFVKRFEK